MNGPQDGDNDASDPFAGLADGYDGDDELMLEALGIKKAPASPTPSTPVPPAAPTAGPPGAMPPDVLNAILAAIPDVVRSAINEKNVPRPAAVESQEANVAPDEPPVSARAEQVEAAPAPEFELAPELAAFMDEDASPSPVTEGEDAGIEITPEPPKESAERSLDGSGKLQGILGRIRGKPAAEIARGAAPGAQRPSAGDPAAAQQIKNLKLQLEAAKVEVDKARKKLAQLQAETVTFRKRLGDQVKEGSLRGREDVFKAIITVVDSVASALASSEKSRDFDNLYAGVEMIERQFHQVLKPLGLVGVDATGKKFDPSQHEAMRMISTGDAVPGTVVEQIRQGYRAGDKLVRPALVIVEAQAAAEPTKE